MIEVPTGSLYFWCYTMGLKHVDFNELVDAVTANGKSLRKKDIDNYWNGWYRSDLYGDEPHSIWEYTSRAIEPRKGLVPLNEYPAMPDEYSGTSPECRWIPCNSQNKPMIKWGGGCLTLVDAVSWPNQVYLAENNKGCNRIIIDCDGDHGDGLDLETILFLSQYIPVTHTLYKTKLVTDYEGYENTTIDEPASFHLSFTVDRIIPTMHFPFAGIDIIGNKENSLRYIKTKKHNGLQPAVLTDEIWEDICNYIRMRERRHDA